MRLHWLQHVPFEGLGHLATGLAARGITPSCTRLHAGETLPASAQAFDGLIVMGGPMSVHDEAQHPWLAPEKALIRAALDAGRRVLGICLGAQLIAEALGAKVRTNPQPEIGWFPVEASRTAAAHPLGGALPQRFESFHWHGETFSLPPGAVHLARSAACEQQAYAWGARVLGLQFHPEMSVDGVRALCRAEPPTPAATVQDEAEMLSRPQRFAAGRALTERLLEAWCAA